jgi:hypothetical protein
MATLGFLDAASDRYEAGTEVADFASWVRIRTVEILAMLEEKSSSSEPQKPESGRAGLEFEHKALIEIGGRAGLEFEHKALIEIGKMMIDTFYKLAPMSFVLNSTLLGALSFLVYQRSGLQREFLKDSAYIVSIIGIVYNMGRFAP